MDQELEFVGKVYGRLKVIRCLSDGSRKWLCICKCGAKKEIHASNILSGRTKSCGCLRREDSRLKGLAKRTHGMSRTPEHKAWLSMRRRCHQPKDMSYKSYGARGIVVCDEWRYSFESFFRDMGLKPFPNSSLDRIDNSGNYCKENCRWSDTKTQMNNRRSNRWIEFNGERKTIAEWSAITGLAHSAILKRLNRGLTPSDILTKPLKRYLHAKSKAAAFSA